MTDAGRPDTASQAPGCREGWGRGSKTLCPAGSRIRAPRALAPALSRWLAPCPSREEALTSLRVLRVSPRRLCSERHRRVPGVLCPAPAPAEPSVGQCCWGGAWQGALSLRREAGADLVPPAGPAAELPPSSGPGTRIRRTAAVAMQPRRQEGSERRLQLRTCLHSDPREELAPCCPVWRDGSLSWDSFEVSCSGLQTRLYLANCSQVSPHSPVSSAGKWVRGAAAGRKMFVRQLWA